jgi:hypothetical protein
MTKPDIFSLSQILCVADLCGLNMLFFNYRMERVTVHWGEMPESQSIGAEIIPAELRNLLILKAAKSDPLMLHQPCKQDDGLSE